VIEAKTGPEALDRAISASPRLILLEFALPDMNGCEVMARLKHNTATQNIPVFFQLTEANAQDIRWPDGAKEILYKPFDLGDLPGLLRKHLSQPPVGILPGSSKTDVIR
jgi:CheY-like chemotaxis protein